MRVRLHELWHTFPVRLFLLHFREHFILVLVWLILALVLQGQLFTLFGIRLLLLLPEYLGRISGLSYLLTGSAFGVLLMTWNLVTYLLYARRFPFLATLARPFTLFSLNNALVPVLVLAYYLTLSVRVQIAEAGFDPTIILGHMLAFIGGMTLVLLLLFLYLAYTNTDIRYLPPLARRGMARRERRIEQGGKANWGVHTYLSTQGRFRLVRQAGHYHPELVRRVYRQNHLNTLLLQLVSLVILVLLGQGAEWSLFRFPAGASLLILFAILLAVIGGISYWFGPWRFMVLLVLLLFIEGGSARSGRLRPSPAYGMDYRSPDPPSYRLEALDGMAHPEAAHTDRERLNGVLDRWKKRQTAEKPVLVILSASGGGLKAARWTMLVLQELEASLSEPLLSKVALMTGASGGTLALAYQRELWRLDQEDGGFRRQDTLYREHISRDLLNSVAFSLVSSDLFRLQSRFSLDGQEYIKDRGYHFERQLQENTDYLLDKRLGEYALPEEEATIPLLIISPTVLNDGRRLLISPLGARHLCRPDPDAEGTSPYAADGVDFLSFFEKRGASRLPMGTALRMNATFPYVLPTVGLPSEPVMHIMDAGMRDNFGVSLALRFLHQHREWIASHVSEVLHIQVRCWEKDPPIEAAGQRGLIGEAFRPFSLLGEQSRFQDYDHDAATGLMEDVLGGTPLRVERFIYEPLVPQNPASLSLHLTHREKWDIAQAWYRPRNQEALARIKAILEDH